MKMKLVLVENDETLCTELKELLAFYNVFDIVHTRSEEHTSELQSQR